MAVAVRGANWVLPGAFHPESAPRPSAGMRLTSLLARFRVPPQNSLSGTTTCSISLSAATFTMSKIVGNCLHAGAVYADMDSARVSMRTLVRLDSDIGVVCGTCTSASMHELHNAPGFAKRLPAGGQHLGVSHRHRILSVLIATFPRRLCRQVAKPSHSHKSSPSETLSGARH